MSSTIHWGRLKPSIADHEQPFAVFLIGARVNKLWKVHQWLPVARAMPRLMRELHAHPELGYLGGETWGGFRSLTVQYWRSMDHLLDYARSRDHEHLPVWRAFNKRARTDAVGIWHEAYVVDPARVQAVYVNMPAFGLAAVADRLLDSPPVSARLAA